MTTPAHIVITKFGGHGAVAEALNIDLSRVYRWTYDKARGGTGGIIPAKHQAALMAAAQVRGVELSPADFFQITAPPPSGEGADAA